MFYCIVKIVSIVRFVASVVANVCFVHCFQCQQTSHNLDSPLTCVEGGRRQARRTAVGERARMEKEGDFAGR